MKEHVVKNYINNAVAIQVLSNNERLGVQKLFPNARTFVVPNGINIKSNSNNSDKLTAL